MAKGTHLTENEFNAIKTMLGAGMKQKDIANVMKISVSTVEYCKRAESFENYKNIRKQEIQRSKSKAKPPNSRETIDSSANRDARIVYELWKIIASLYGMAKAIDENESNICREAFKEI